MFVGQQRQQRQPQKYRKDTNGIQLNHLCDYFTIYHSMFFSLSLVCCCCAARFFDCFAAATFNEWNQKQQQQKWKRKSFISIEFVQSIFFVCCTLSIAIEFTFIYSFRLVSFRFVSFIQAGIAGARFAEQPQLLLRLLLHGLCPPILAPWRVPN